MSQPREDTPQESALNPPPLPKAPARRGRRWLRRLGVALLVLFLGALVGHWWWGRGAARRLDALVAAARAAGEPVTVEELNRWPASRGGTGENIVPALRA